MKSAILKYRKTLDEIRESGTWKNERIITTPQRSRIDTTQATHVVNMCANNYLGLSDNKDSSKLQRPAMTDGASD